MTKPFRPDIAADGERLAAFLLHQADGLFGVPILFEIDEGDLRSLPREGQGRRSPDAAVSPGDEHHLVLEAANPWIAGLELRTWLHDVFPARLLRLGLRRRCLHLLPFL